MDTMGEGEMLVGLDIGTSKVVVIVAETRINDSIQILGIGSHPSEGLRNGVVVDIESTTLAIKKSIEEAESMAGCHIASCYVGISGSHIKGLNSEGVVPIKDGEVKFVKKSHAQDCPRDEWPFVTLEEHRKIQIRKTMEERKNSRKV